MPFEAGITYYLQEYIAKRLFGITLDAIPVVEMLCLGHSPTAAGTYVMPLDESYMPISVAVTESTFSILTTPTDVQVLNSQNLTWPVAPVDYGAVTHVLCFGGTRLLAYLPITNAPRYWGVNCQPRLDMSGFRLPFIKVH